MISRHFLPLCGLLIGLASAMPLPAQAAPAETGDLWEDTLEMAIPGMPARPQTHRRCSARNADAVPMANKDNNCTMSDVKRSGNAMSWKMSCAGTPPTTGAAEMVYEGRDRYRGTMTINAEGPGDDDEDERPAPRRLRRRRGAAQARRDAASRSPPPSSRANDAMAATCKGAVDGLIAADARTRLALRLRPAAQGRVLQAPADPGRLHHRLGAPAQRRGRTGER